jgi:hypothetical protein
MSECTTRKDERAIDILPLARAAPHPSVQPTLGPSLALPAPGVILAEVQLFGWTKRLTEGLVRRQSVLLLG